MASQYVREIVTLLRRGEFQTVADAIEDEIASGKTQFVRRTTKDKRSSASVDTDVFEAIATTEMSSTKPPRGADLRVEEFADSEAIELTNNALRRIFVDPILLVEPTVKCLGRRDPSLPAIIFADPADPSIQFSLDEYVDVLSAAAVAELKQMLEA